MLTADFKEIHKQIRFSKRNPVFIRLQHPQANVPPDKESVAELLRMGWWGQKKVNGFRCQTHITAKGEMSFFTRQGRLHSRQISDEIKETLEQLIPETGINVFDAEWQIQLNKLFVFDMYTQESQLLRKMNYAERHQILRDEYAFLSPCVEFLPVYKTVKDCMRVLSKAEPYLEGLVFRFPKDFGWQNSSIMRCLIKDKTG